jgi:putative peptidoglycan lipid II flippase
MVVILYASSGITTVMFPALSEAAASRDAAKFSGLAARGMRLILLITAPLTVVVYALREPMVRLMFDHGALSRAGVADVSAMVALLLWQALPGNMNFFLLKVCYAHDDTRWPAVIVTAANVFLALVISFGVRGGATGILVAFDVMQWAIMFALVFRIVTAYSVRESPVFGAKTALLAALAGVPAFFGHWVFRNFETSGMMDHFAELAIGGLLTAPVVFFAARALRFDEAREIAAYAQSRFVTLKLRVPFH